MDEPGLSHSRRRSRASGGRDRQIKVRLSEEEHEQVSARARASGLTEASYLALCGMENLVGSSSSHLSLTQLRAWVAELYALKRILRGSATNLNQLTKLANATDEVPQESWHHGERIARMESRLSELLDAIGPELLPRGDEE